MYKRTSGSLHKNRDKFEIMYDTAPYWTFLRSAATQESEDESTHCTRQRHQLLTSFLARIERAMMPVSCCVLVIPPATNSQEVETLGPCTALLANTKADRVFYYHFPTYHCSVTL